MFNNPFDSFHNTVAEAKKEREQLDRLLTISTPRERLLVAAIAALLVILAAWLSFGNVHRSVALDGVLVEPESAGGVPLASESTSSGLRSVQALVWVHRGVARDIGVGMPALVELAVEVGDAATWRQGRGSRRCAAGRGAGFRVLGAGVRLPRRHRAR